MEKEKEKIEIDFEGEGLTPVSLEAIERGAIIVLVQKKGEKNEDTGSR